MGTGHRVAWCHLFLEVLPVSAGAAPRSLSSKARQPGVPGLAGCHAERRARAGRLCALAGTAVPEAATVAETVRGEAQRAVLAFELVRRAARIVPLAAIDAECWAASLATLPVICARDGVRQKLRLCSTHLPR
ncbi:MAG: hypothetical protein FD152_253 [Xanthobacteraceae bacterium]|nr:MAG: hypothetical protein FD152_253 [Xanthobacteraceae bacterium]